MMINENPLFDGSNIQEVLGLTSVLGISLSEQSSVFGMSGIGESILALSSTLANLGIDQSVNKSLFEETGIKNMLGVATMAVNPGISAFLGDSSLNTWLLSEMTAFQDTLISGLVSDEPLANTFGAVSPLWGEIENPIGVAGLSMFTADNFNSWAVDHGLDNLQLIGTADVYVDESPLPLEQEEKLGGIVVETPSNTIFPDKIATKTDIYEVSDKHNDVHNHYHTYYMPVKEPNYLLQLTIPTIAGVISTCVGGVLVYVITTKSPQEIIKISIDLAKLIDAL